MTSEERRAAKAESDAAKAREKALRPWYKKKRFMVPLVLVGLVVLGAIASGGGGGSDSGDSGSDEEIVQASIPGEATLEIGDEKTITRFTGVTVRDEAIPGNEFSKAPSGKAYMIFNAEIENAGQEDLDLNSTVYRLKLPTGEILNFTTIGGGEELSFGSTLTPGSKKAGQLSYEIPAPVSGQQYVILWKPNPFVAKQAQFTYVYAG